MNEPSGEDALWRFSLALYPRPKVSEALIRLQDCAGCDVNLMLFALWLGVSRRERLTREKLGTAEIIIGPIRSGLVEPLRALRRKLKSNADADVQRLRNEIKRLELAAEKVIQTRLARLAGVPEGDHDPDSRIAAAIANFTLCVGPQLAAGEEALAICGALQEFIQD